jgi:hypothetical protein
LLQLEREPNSRRRDTYDHRRRPEGLLQLGGAHSSVGDRSDFSLDSVDGFDHCGAHKGLQEQSESVAGNVLMMISLLWRV